MSRTANLTPSEKIELLEYARRVVSTKARRERDPERRAALENFDANIRHRRLQFLRLLAGSTLQRRADIQGVVAAILLALPAATLLLLRLP